MLGRYRAMRESLDVINDWFQSGEDTGALLARLQTLSDVLTGARKPDDAAGEVDTRSLDRVLREQTAIQLLVERGRVTTTDLARASHCSSESARLCLQALAERKVARSWGTNKGRTYQPGRMLPQEIAKLGLSLGRQTSENAGGGDL